MINLFPVGSSSFIFLYFLPPAFHLTWSSSSLSSSSSSLDTSSSPSMLSPILPLLPLSDTLPSPSFYISCASEQTIFINQSLFYQHQISSVSISDKKKNVRSIRLKRELFGRKKHISRRERTDRDCTGGFCCLKTLYFDFREHGMDYIIRPSGFNMNFCDGECNDPLQTTDRDLLILHDGINHPKSPFRRRLSCCVPIRWASVEVVENKTGIERNRLLRNVKVVECGCVI